jgi:hypothetical protein
MSDASRVESLKKVSVLVDMRTLEDYELNGDEEYFREMV